MTIDNMPAPEPRTAAEIANEWATLSTFEWVEKAVEYVLRQRNITDKSHAISGNEIYVAATELLAVRSVPPNTFSSYLSALVKQAECPFSSTGRGRGGGYYLSLKSETLAQDVSAVPELRSDQSVIAERTKEKYLYPSLVSWMVGQGYKARDTSNIRTLGKWGNPDVTGLLIHEHLTRMEIEASSIEAKVGLESWEIDFFQAVSQRRFANRAYFAFALPEELSEKLPADLRYYSELFEVGVLAIEIPDDTYTRLKDGTLTPEDKKLLDGHDSGLVREVLSAPWHHVPATYQRKFCEALNIRDLQELMSWGIETA